MVVAVVVAGADLFAAGVEMIAAVAVALGALDAAGIVVGRWSVADQWGSRPAVPVGTPVALVPLGVV